MRRSPYLRPFTCLAVFAALVGVSAALAITVPDPRPLDEMTFDRAGGVMGAKAVAHARLPETDPLKRDWDRFLASHDGRWSVWLDERTGLPSLAQGRGIAWFPARGNDLTTGPEPTIENLAELARRFIDERPVILGSFGDQLVLDVDASSRIADRVFRIVFRQELDGVPVEGARYDFDVSHGNLVAFGASFLTPVRISAAPSLSSDEARAELDAYLSLDTRAGLYELEAPELVIVPFDASGENGSHWSGPRGQGLDHRLIWRFRFTDETELPTWTGEVDAHTGEVFAFYDDTRHEQVKGDVNPVSDDGDCANDGCLEPNYPMPFVDYTVDGGAVQYGNDFGLYECTNTGSTIATTLDGKYFWINEQCGAISESTLCDEPLDMGGSGGLNCEVAPDASAGNTDAARSAYFSLNRVNQKARFWIPDNTWLQGQVECRTNVNSTCNASWSGRINMYRAGNGCGNTSQIQGVVTHEWGHGFDQNDGGGYDESSESYADVVAIFESRESCVGRGFYADGRTCSGYGDTCLECTGIRDHDWSKRERNTPATPTNFTADCGAGGGSCGRQVHCESYVSSETIFDLATRDLTGTAGLDPDTAWQTAERLWYQSRPGSGGPIYNCSLPDSDSCGTDNWYHAMRLADDDDGDLSNGTPHAAAIYAAFARHDIACGNAGDPENQSTSSCPTLDAPVVSTRALTNAVELTWDPVPNASSYRVYRADIGCDRVQVPLAETTDTTYLDEGIANDFTVYYRVVALGSNSACEGPLSTCTDAAAQALAGRVKFDRSTYGCSNTMNLTVTDANHSTGTIVIDVWSGSEPTPEPVTLVETAVGSGKYTGSLMTTSDPAAADGMLTIADGDTITAEYIDEDNGEGGTNVPVQSTASGDCVFPVISAVDEEDVSGDSARVVWLTNEISDTTLRWGETTPPTNLSTGSNSVTDHEVFLGGLQECTVYFYEVESTDPAGNTATDDNGGNYYRFETLGDFGSGLQPCRAGQVSVGGPVYSCSDVATFELVDIDLNADPLVAEIATILISSTTETQEEVLTLTETGPNTSVFQGSIATSTGAPVQDGVLQTAHGDLMTATYLDADDGAGFPATSFDTANLDCAGAGVSNLRVDTITNARATFRFDSDEQVETTIDWGFTPALGNVETDDVLRTAHAMIVNDFEICGDVYFRITTTDRYGNVRVFDDGGEPFVFRTYDIPGLYVYESFEDGAAGWSLDGEWEVGSPQGLGGSSGIEDPSDAYNNDQVLGHDLTGQGSAPGDYEPLTDESAWSPIYDGTAWTDTKIIMHRHLNAPLADEASFVLYTNGVGRPLYRNTDGETASSYEFIEYPIDAFADGASEVQLQFRQSTTITGNYSGWNVDDIIIKDATQPDYAACGSCGTPPSFAGATSATDNDACGASGVTVSWERAVAWGTGSTGSYAVYRDTTPGFTPSVGNRIAEGVTTLSYNDLSAPTDQDVYYLVRAENDETCSTGPANGGSVDDNTVYVGVSETTSQAIPGSVDTVLVDDVAETHVRLSWQPIAAATSYRIYRSTSPEPGTFGLLAETSDTVFEDVGELTNANTFYYKVTGVNACGDEGP